MYKKHHLKDTHKVPAEKLCTKSTYFNNYYYYYSYQSCTETPFEEHWRSTSLWKGDIHTYIQLWSILYQIRTKTHDSNNSFKVSKHQSMKKISIRTYNYYQSYSYQSRRKIPFNNTHKVITEKGISIRNYNYYQSSSSQFYKQKAPI